MKTIYAHAGGSISLNGRSTLKRFTLVNQLRSLLIGLVLIVPSALHAQDITFNVASIVIDADVGNYDFVYFGFTNNSAATLNISDVTITGVDADQFSYDGGNKGNPPYVVNTGATLFPLVVEFSPTTAGTKTATLNVFSDSPESPHTLSIIGTSQVPIKPELSVSIVNNFNFGNVPLGEPDTVSIKVYNDGNTDLNISDLTISNVSGSTGQYQLLTVLSFPHVIGFNDSTDLEIVLTTTSAIQTSARTGKLMIAHDDPDIESPFEINFQFNEEGPIPINNDIDFGLVEIGSDSTISIKTKNEGNGDLVITGVNFSSDSDLLVTSSSFPITVAALDSVELDVKFTPDAIGAINSVMTIEGNVSSSINISGRGVNRTLSFTDTVDFGDVYSDENYGVAASGINLSAVGGLPVTITSFTISGADASSYGTLSSISLPKEITSSYYWYLNFLSGKNTKGIKNATVTMTSDAVNSPHVFQITGNAIFPPILSSSETFLSIDLLYETTLDTVLTLTNSGDEPLEITHLYLDASPDMHPQIRLLNIPSLPVTLESDEELILDVRFQPNGYNDLTGNIVIVSNSSEDTRETIVLYADIVSPIAFISDEFSQPRDSLLFGAVSTARATTDSLLVVNEGDGGLIISNVALSGDGSGSFNLLNTAYPIVVGPVDSLWLPIEFAPTTSATSISTLNILSNNVVPMNTTLKGNGIQPVLSFSSTIPFLDQTLLGTTSVAVQTFANVDDDPATIYGFELSGADASLFTLSGPETPVTLYSGITAAVEVTFDPLVAGSYSAQLEMISDAVNGPLIATISATAFSASIFSTDTLEVLISGVEVGASRLEKIGIKNEGNENLELTSAFFESGSSGAFSAGPNDFGLPLTIAPGETDSVEVLYAPVLGGAQVAVLSILTNDEAASEVFPTNRARISLTGTALGPLPVYSVTRLDFDSTFVGFEKVLSFDVTNEGVGALEMDFVYADPEGLFSVLYEGYDLPPNPEAFLPISVEAGATQQINVVFRPQEFVTTADSISLTLRDVRNERYEVKFPVTGIGAEPPLVTIGGITIVGDDFERVGPFKTLLGNVHIDDLELGDKVMVDLANETIVGAGDVFVTDVPPNGAMKSGKVKIRTDGFAYFVNGADKILSINPDEDTGKDFFDVIGLTLKMDDIHLLDDGVLTGGGLALPEVVFGADAGFFLDSIRISKNTGVDIVGTTVIAAPLTVFDAFSLDDVAIEFDTFKDCFSGGGSISIDAGIELSISAEIVLKNGGLDGVTLEVETLPGIPLGNTGFALAGGNGSIGGLQVPPISLALGIDLVPVPPGANKVVRFDNVGFSYTFGDAFVADGTLFIFGMEVAAAYVEGTDTGVTADAYFSLLEIFKGNAGLSVQVIEEKLFVSGNAGLAYTIPEIPSGGTPDFIRGAFNTFLPITLAEVSTSFTQDRITGAVVYPPIPARLSVTIRLEDDVAKVTFGAEFTLYNPDSKGGRNGRMEIAELPYLIAYENDAELNRQSHLEGQSILINSRVDSRGRALSTEAVEATEFPFSLSGSLESVIIRVEGADEAPEFSIVLPTGQEVNADNALSMGYAYTVYEEGKQAHIFLSNTISGDYMIKIDATGEFQIDIAGAEFGPRLMLKDAVFDENTNDMEINWEDEDLDSDAKISLYYDMDQEGANGKLIASELSEDDALDQYIWNAAGVPNGMYYIYGVMDDGTSLPSISYAAEPITIARASAIEVPVLETPIVDGSNVKLNWTASAEANNYQVFYAEEGSVSSGSPSFNAGGKLEMTIPNLIPGRDYEFAIVARDENLVHSNLSNVVTLSFMSDTENNVPRISQTGIVNKVKVGEAYLTTISASDADDDVLTYSLIIFPEGMTITDNVISWTPTASQVGSEQVALKVEDPSLASDSVMFTITVINEESSSAFLSFNAARFNGLDQIVQVTLTDPGLNTSSSTMESQELIVSSSSDPTGTSIILTESSTNSGLFVGSFGFVSGSSSAGQIGVSVADSVFVSYQDSFPNEEVKRYVLFEQSEIPNEYPTSISINNAVVRDEASLGDLIGVLTTEDIDDIAHTYELVDGTGSEHNHLFAIDGQALAVNASLSGLKEATLNVRVRSNDGKNGFYEQTFALTLEDVLGASEENILLSEVHLYPNPTSRKVFVNIDSERGPITITILSSEGRMLQSEVFDKRWNGSKISMNVSELPAGVYFVQVEQLGQIVNKRLIKE